MNFWIGRRSTETHQGTHGISNLTTVVDVLSIVLNLLIKIYHCCSASSTGPNLGSDQGIPIAEEVASPHEQTGTLPTAPDLNYLVVKPSSDHLDAHLVAKNHAPGFSIPRPQTLDSPSRPGIAARKQASVTKSPSYTDFNDPGFLRAPIIDTVSPKCSWICFAQIRYFHRNLLI